MNCRGTEYTLLALYPKKLANVAAVIHSNWCSGKSHAHYKSITASHLYATIAGAWTCLPYRTTMPWSTRCTSCACKGKLPPVAATAAITPKSNTFTDYGAKPRAVVEWSKNPTLDP